MNVHTQADFDELLSEPSSLVVVEFCLEPDKSTQIHFKDLCKKFENVKFARLLLESAEESASISLPFQNNQYNIENTPKLVLFRNKTVLEAIDAKDLDVATAAIKRHAPECQFESKPQVQADSTLSPKDSTSSFAPGIMWTLPPVDLLALPLPQHLSDALTQLRITLLSKTQLAALRLDRESKSEVVEPTLALYCPIEGGEYVIDATIKHLAEKIGADIQVVDMAHVAAGRWGHFGISAAKFRFRQNPLGKVRRNEGFYDSDDGEKNVKALEKFWREIITMDPHVDPDTPSTTRNRTGFNEDQSRGATDKYTTTTPPKSIRPRIVYLRDFDILSSSVSTWFPPLYTALCERRLGGSVLSSSESARITHPTTVVFGVSPPLARFHPTLHGEAACRCEMCQPSAKRWDESETRERAERLKQLKDKWNCGRLVNELPEFYARIKIFTPTIKTEDELEPNYVMSKQKADAESEAKTRNDQEDKSEESASEDSKPKPKIYNDYNYESDSTDKQQLSGYFQLCPLTPAKQNSKLERAARRARRKELNELMVRMRVGVKGGEMEPGAAPVSTSKKGRQKISETEHGRGMENEEKAEGLLEGWGEHLLDTSALGAVVDRTLSAALLAQEDGSKLQSKTPIISWTHLSNAWNEKKKIDEERKTWVELNDKADGSDQESDDEKDKSNAGTLADRAVENLKEAYDLDEYERRLMGCIVDVAKITTTFETVHLPAKVIDNIRSVISLPLLYPEAFKSGILKQQAISGALLFGPPGTGKTHVVRALAKESGSRMIAIKPSDVTDKWLGETEKLVRSLFKLARRLKPCVVFIDEIDSIMGSRMSDPLGGASMWHTRMLTEFMQEMDGLVASRVMVIGATNRPFDIDDAVLRRLPCRLLVDLPDENAREEILKIMLRDDELGSDITAGELARKTDKFSGSDLKNLCVAAAIDALKESVELPWATNQIPPNAIKSTGSTPTTTEPAAEIPEIGSAKPSSSKTSHNDMGSSKLKIKSLEPRVLAARHFARALMDVAPSSSESQGSLSKLRRWNAQFGTGAQNQSMDRPTGDRSDGSTGKISIGVHNQYSDF